MQITAELLEEITRQVLCAVRRQTADPRPTALLFGDPACWNTLTERFVLADKADYQGTIEPFALLLIDGITGAELADAACGRDDSPLTRAVSDALCAGRPVYLAAEGLAHRACKETANPRYYAMLEDYVTRLSQFGVRVGTRAALAEQLGATVRDHAQKEPAASETGAVSGLVTAERAGRLARECGGRLVLAADVKLTPLAQDLLREKKIALEWQREETGC